MSVEDEIAAQQELVTKAGDTVRALKAQLKDGKVERVSISIYERHPLIVCTFRARARHRLSNCRLARFFCKVLPTSPCLFSLLLMHIYVYILPIYFIKCLLLETPMTGLPPFSSLSFPVPPLPYCPLVRRGCCH